MDKLIEVLSTIGGRIGWDTWGLPYRLGVALAAVLLAYWAVRAVIPTTFRLLRPLVFLAAVAVAVAALFPGQSCQVDWMARIAPFCGRT